MCQFLRVQRCTRYGKLFLSKSRDWIQSWSDPYRSPATVHYVHYLWICFNFCEHIPNFNGHFLNSLICFEYWIFLKNHEHFLFPENLFETVIVFYNTWTIFWNHDHFMIFRMFFLIHKQFIIFQDFFWNIFFLEITNKFKEEKTKTEMRTWKAKNEIKAGALQPANGPAYVCGRSRRACETKKKFIWNRDSFL